VRAENRKLKEDLIRTEHERDVAVNRLRTSAWRRCSRCANRSRRPRSRPVVASGLASGSATLLIDRGTVDGVHAGMPVIGVGGVVGRILPATYARRSVLTDSAAASASP
jgi:cell shape-determining protein MreC